MLVKLLKYEINDTVKTFTPFYIIVLFLTMAASFLLKLSITNDFLTNNTVGSIFLGTVIFLAIVSFTVVLCMVSFFIMSRFYKNLIKTEGYFMHSLPVSPHLLILSKMISSIILVIFTIIFTIMCAFGVVLIFNEIPMDKFLEGLKIVVFDGIFTLTFWASIISGVLYLYASIAMGSLFQNKFLGAIIAYIGYSTIRTFVSALFTFGIDYTADVTEVFTNTMNMTNTLSIIFGIISYVITYYIFQNKLNLE